MSCGTTPRAARTLLKDPPILVFDEATSALDSKTEKSIQAELADISRDRTTLVIAHRLSTIVDADLILVLEHGEIVERGNFFELMQRNGRFAEMWKLQQEQQAAPVLADDLPGDAPQVDEGSGLSPLEKSA